jgi:hypothetical protein
MTKPSWRYILLKGARTFPVVPWRSHHRWRTKWLTLAILILGFAAFGVGEALLVVSGIGVSPWVVLAQGISLRTGISIGTATFAVSATVLLFWIPLRERPGLGTVLNSFIIGYVMEYAINVLPRPDAPATQVLCVLLGILTVGVGSALYLTTNLGPGPRDGLMTSLHDRTGIRVSRVRLSLELMVLTLGWVLGGTVGIGTLLFAMLIGRSIALWLGVLGRLTHTP